MARHGSFKDMNLKNGRDEVRERTTVYVNRMETTGQRTQHGHGHGTGVWMIPLFDFLIFC
jgi:hypothetical protein